MTIIEPTLVVISGVHDQLGATITHILSSAVTALIINDNGQMMQ